MIVLRIHLFTFILIILTYTNLGYAIALIGYNDLHSPGCHICFDEIIKYELSDFTIYLICYELDEKDITSEDMKVALDKVVLFERLDLKVQRLHVGEFS